MKTTPEKRIEMAVELARDYAQIDGDHHKLWVIDNMLRLLLGKKEYEKFVEEYEKFVEEYYEEDEDGEVEYEWETGIAP